MHGGMAGGMCGGGGCMVVGGMHGCRGHVWLWGGVWLWVGQAWL